MTLGETGKQGKGRAKVGRRHPHPLVPADLAPELHEALRRYSEREGDESPDEAESARLIARFQAGDKEAFTALYKHWFERVFTYLRVALNDVDEAEDAAQQSFMQAFEALPRYEQRGKPFEAWLFTIVRNQAITRLQRMSRVEVVDPDELNRRRELAGEAAEDEPSSINWIADGDLMLFVERLPLIQRQVLVLRFVLDLPGAEVARILERSHADVRILQYRALRFLEERLTAIGRGPGSRERAKVRTPLRQAPVLRARRWALLD